MSKPMTVVPRTRNGCIGPTNDTVTSGRIDGTSFTALPSTWIESGFMKISSGDWIFPPPTSWPSCAVAPSPRMKSRNHWLKAIANS